MPFPLFRSHQSAIRADLMRGSVDQVKAVRCFDIVQGVSIAKLQICKGQIRCSGVPIISSR